MSDSSKKTPLALFTSKCLGEIGKVDPALPELLVNLNGKINAHRLKKKLEELNIKYKLGKCSVETNLWFLTLHLIQRPLFKGELWKHFEIVFDLDQLSKDDSGVIQKTKLEKLGRGATAAVYKLTVGQNNLALKCMDSKTPTARANIEYEIRVLLQLNNSTQCQAIPKIWDWWSSPSKLYILMQDGGSPLNKRLALLQNNYVYDLALQLFRGLHTMHSAGIVHRDIKPANILYRIENGKVQGTFVDFGLAFLCSDPRRITGLAGTPNFLGYWLWIAKYRGMDNMDSYKAGDIWALLATLFYVLYGVSPLQGKIVTIQGWNEFINSNSESRVIKEIGNFKQPSELADPAHKRLAAWLVGHLSRHRQQVKLELMIRELQGLINSSLQSPNLELSDSSTLVSTQSSDTVIIESLSE